MAKTKAAIKEHSTDEYFARVFTVGLGDGVSTETCDGIARAGGGMSVYIRSDKEKFMGKCTRLVSAARTVPVTNIKVHWETSQPVYPTPTQIPSGPISLSGPSFQFPTDVGPLTSSRQAPVCFPDFFYGTRLHAYAIVPKSTAATNSLMITGYIPAKNQAYQEVIPINPVLHSYQNRFLHTCAAKMFIMDLEDVNISGMSAQQSKQVKDDIIYYGTTFGLTSRHTSFLAIDNNKPTPCPVGLGHDIFTMFAVAPSTTPGAAANYATPVTAAFKTAPVTVAVASSAGKKTKKKTYALGADVAANITTTSTPEANDTNDVVPNFEADLNVLFKLSAMQSTDGGFSAKTFDVITLLLPLCGFTAQQILDKYSISDEKIVAAFLAWAWMTLCCGEEVDGMKGKADAWLLKNAKGVDVSVIQNELLQA